MKDARATNLHPSPILTGENRPSPSPRALSGNSSVPALFERVLSSLLAPWLLVAPMERDSGSSEEGGLFAGLFVDEDYVDQEFDFGQAVPGPPTRLLCSQAASTDFDLTGQVVWPVSIFLSWFIAQRTDHFRDKVIVELGKFSTLLLIPSRLVAHLLFVVVKADPITKT